MSAFKSPALQEARSIRSAAPRRASPTGILHFTIGVADLERARREVAVVGLEQEGIETATMVDRFQSICRNPQPDFTAERIRQQRDVQ